MVVRLREREAEGELERLSVTDALTGLWNRRHLMGTLANEVQRSRRLRRTFSVLLADVDHFKQYNDTHGHLAGDAVLVKVAAIFRKMTRSVDSVARYGGGEVRGGEVERAQPAHANPRRALSRRGDVPGHPTRQ